ncbi:MAG: hypothetical protein ACOZB0_04605 [Pseudomonadota bacterium]
MPISRLDPVAAAQAQPRSKQKAINAFCYLCMGGADTEHPSLTKARVRDCPTDTCPLHPHRPWQKNTTGLPKGAPK